MTIMPVTPLIQHTVPMSSMPKVTIVSSHAENPNLRHRNRHRRRHCCYVDLDQMEPTRASYQRMCIKTTLTL